jgi:flagellar biosynthesis anti-sigma factor FlgM
MRIDANTNAQALPEGQRALNPAAVKQNVPAEAGTANPLGEDQAQLSSVHPQLQALVAQLAQLPESGADSEKISALRQAIARGSYQPSPQKVAGALLENLAVSRAA